MLIPCKPNATLLRKMSPFGVLPLLLSLVSSWRIYSEAHCHAHDGLLYPISGDTRDTLWLDGTWKLRFAKQFDPEEGFRDSWYSRPLDQVSFYKHFNH